MPPATTTSRALAGRGRRATLNQFALAWIDISTGEFRLTESDRAGLAAEIARLEPGEVIVSDALYGDPELAPYLRSLPAVTPLPRDVFDGATAERRLADYFAVATTEAFGTFSRLELTAAAALRHLCGAHAARQAPAARAAGARGGRHDAEDRRRDAHQSRAHPHALGRAARPLLAAIDRTVTPAGARRAGAAARRPAHRSGAHRATARRGRGLHRRRRAAARGARRPEGRARSRPLARPHRGRPRRSARPRRHPRRPRRGAAFCRNGSRRRP